MVVTAVNDINLNRGHKVGFGRREPKRDTEPVVMPTTSGAKAIPVVVLLAMSPVNATPQEALAQLSEKNSVTMYSQLPQIEAPNALEVAQNPKKPQITQKDIDMLNTAFVYRNYIVWDKFRGDDNKNHLLVLLYDPDRPKNEIIKIYIIPEDYKVIKKNDGYRIDHPPDVDGFIYHESANGNDDFLGVTLWSRSRENQHLPDCWEMRLPDEIGDKLADLLLGKTPYKYVGNAQLEFTQSRELKTKFY